jgi:hypothetical protein
MVASLLPIHFFFFSPVSAFDMVEKSPQLAIPFVIRNRSRRFELKH